MILRVLIGLCAALAFAGAEARDAWLEWDGVPTASGYRVHVGDASGTYQTIYDAGQTTDYIVGGLDAAQDYYFAVSAYTATQESGFSNELLLNSVAASIDSVTAVCEASPPMAVPTIVQQKDGPQTSGTSQTVTFDSAVASGNGILVLVRARVTSNTNDTLDAATIADGTNSYAMRGSQVRGFSGDGYNFAIYTATAGSASAFAVTVTPEASTSELRTSIFEIGNWSGVSVPTQTVSNYSSSTTTVVNWDFTNTTSGDYLLIAGAHIQSEATATPDSGWTNLSPGSEMKMISKTVTGDTPAVNDPGMTLDTARRWVGVAMAIPGGAGATASLPPSFIRNNPMQWLGVR